MKYLKTYNQINEGLVRSKMLPKTEEEIIDDLNNLSLEDLLYRLQYFWIKFGNVPTDGERFSDYVNNVIGRDLWGEIREKYKDSWVKDEYTDVWMRHEYNPYRLIFNSNFTKEDVIKLILGLQDRINESLRDMMKPKTEEEIEKGLKKIPSYERIVYVENYGLDDKFLPTDEEIDNDLKKLKPIQRIKFIKYYGLDDKFLPPSEDVENELDELNLDELKTFLSQTSYKIWESPIVNYEIIDFTKNHLNIDIWERLRDNKIKNNKYVDDRMLYFQIEDEYLLNIINDSNLNKEEIIKILLKIYEIFKKI